MKTLKQNISTVIAFIFLISLVALGILLIGKIFIEEFSFLGEGNFVQRTFVRKGIYINSPRQNSLVSSPLNISGTIYGDNWIAFEGQAGTVKLVNSKGKVLAFGILKTEEDWMKLPVKFETTLEFVLSQEENGKLIFKNENPSGDEQRNKEYILNVKIKRTGETLTVKVFWGNSNLDPEFSCNKVFGTERIIAKTEAIARAALEELLKGPTNEEEQNGNFTSINQGVKIQSLTIENGIAKVDFDSQLEFQVGGSCRVGAIRAQIVQTLKQFPAVKEVIISINNRTEDILQP